MQLLPRAREARILTVAVLTNTVGNGVWTTAGAIYLVHSVGLSLNDVGIGFTAFALVGIAASSPIGYLADRHGPRLVLLAGLVAGGALAPLLIAIDSLPAFLAVGSATALSASAVRSSLGAMIAALVPTDERVRTRAYLRSAANLGVSVGAVVAGFAIAADSRGAFVSVILLDAATFLVTAAVVARLPVVAAATRPAEGPRLIALRDRPFLAFVLLDGAMSVHYGLLSVALPLWITLRTDAPRWFISVLLVVNTVIVVVFQVRAARSTERVTGAARAARRAGAAIALACALFAFSGDVPGPVAVALLIAGALAHVTGELWHAAAGWGISFGLTPAGAHGQYQGTFGMGMELGRMLAPLVLTTLAVGAGAPGWLLLGGMFLLLGAAVPRVATWAVRNREARAEVRLKVG